LFTVFYGTGKERENASALSCRIVASRRRDRTTTVAASLRIKKSKTKTSKQVKQHMANKHLKAAKKQATTHKSIYERKPVKKTCLETQDKNKLKKKISIRIVVVCRRFYFPLK